jgi:hypothetical protein
VQKAVTSVTEYHQPSPWQRAVVELANQIQVKSSRKMATQTVLHQ